MQANKVSSLPRPTLRPGLCRVPRWRTRMVPAWTSWPEKRFTPRRCPCESRPFVEEPPPFLCAIGRSFRAELDVADFHGGIVLPVAAHDFVLLGLAVLHDRQLGPAALLNNLASDLGLGGLSAGQQFLLVGAHGQDLGKRHLAAHLAGKPLDPNGFSRGNAVLLAPRANDSVHRAS